MFQLSHKNGLFAFIFSSVILSLFTVQAQPAATTGCLGFCGFQSDTGCWCDSFCVFTFDCCDDRCEHCFDELNNCDISPPPPYHMFLSYPPSFAPPDQSCVVEVYDDGLSSDWEDWSYFSKVFMKAKKPFQGTNSIKLTLQPFGALRLHAKFDISSFDSLEMWISRKVSKKQTMQLAGSSPPIDLNVILGVFPEPKFIDAVEVHEEGTYSDEVLIWKKYSIPIPQDVGEIKDVILQNPTPKIRKYFIDSIMLLGQEC